MIRILLADDHPVVREGFKQMLADYEDMLVTGEAGTSQEVLNKVHKNDYDVLLLDIFMPGRSGLEIISELKKEYPKMAILVISAYPEEQYSVRALKRGASGYLLKLTAPEELITAIRAVAQGRNYISSSLADRLANMIKDDAQENPHERLSDREFQVMRMIVSGESLKEISEELALSDKTVSTYRARILEKMNMKNNAEIIHYAIEQGLVN
jgi:DNA-binding NarL/FixJ family response regulator